MSVVRQLRARLRGDHKPLPVTTPHVRRTFREFIQPLTSPQSVISELCNTGRHYECGGCRCGCHPPLTTWST